MNERIIKCLNDDRERNIYRKIKKENQKICSRYNIVLQLIKEMQKPKTQLIKTINKIYSLNHSLILDSEVTTGMKWSL